MCEIVTLFKYSKLYNRIEIIRTDSGITSDIYIEDIVDFESLQDAIEAYPSAEIINIDKTMQTNVIKGNYTFKDNNLCKVGRDRDYYYHSDKGTFNIDECLLLINHWSMIEIHKEDLLNNMNIILNKKATN